MSGVTPGTVGRSFADRVRSATSSTCRVELGSLGRCLSCLLLFRVLRELSSVLFLDKVQAPLLVRLASPLGGDAPGQLNHSVQSNSPFR